LQILAADGVPEGGRNTTLFNMAIYYKRAFPDGWKTKLAEANAKFCTPPVPDEECDATKKSIERKDFQYQCGSEPLNGHCNSRLCGLRTYGVGNGSFYPRILSVRKIVMEKAIWLIEIDGCDRVLKLDDIKKLFYYDYFVQECIEQLNMDFRPLSREVWSVVRGKALASVEEVIPSEDMTEFGQRKELMRTFLYNRQKGSRREDVLRGAPYQDDDGYHYFRLQDAQKFFKREGEPIKRSQLTDLIARLNGVEPREHGSKKHKPSPGMTEAIETSVKNESVRLWKIPASALSEPVELDVPELPPEVV
jgi:hypothetical protein